MLGKELQSAGVTVLHAAGDADALIATTTINAAKNNSVTLIGEDTDLLILLLHHTSLSSKRIIFRSDKASAKTAIDIFPLKRALGSNLCSKLLFCHSFTGCDTTSRIFGIGKKVAFKKLRDGDNVLSSCAEVFTFHSQTKKRIEEYGRKAMVALFGGNSSETLLTSRSRIFNRKVAGSKSFVGPERLPPTDCATDFHSQRVYLQIMSWTMNDKHGFIRVGMERRRGEEDNHLVPKMTNEDAAPPNLLKMIHCNCKTGCDTPRCGCRRYGLQCTNTCGSCQLEGYENCITIDLQEDDDESEDDE